MDTGLKEMLQSAGIEVDSALERFMGNEMIYRKFAWRFLDDPSCGALKAAFEAGDAQAAFEAAHTLKGVCGNLSFNRLYQIAGRLVEPLRQGDLEQAREALPEFERAYEETAAALEKWKAAQ